MTATSPTSIADFFLFNQLLVAARLLLSLGRKFKEIAMSVNKIGIEWTNSTWNPFVGCRRISPGCMHCYAERMSSRQAAMQSRNPSDGKRRYYLKVIQHNHWNGEVRFVPEVLSEPLTWTDPRMIFVNSMSDTFHENVLIDDIRSVFDIIAETHWHTFQMLTKRSDRLLELSAQLIWPDNLWMGVSVETAPYVKRIDDLRKTGAKVKFISIEPLLGPISNLDLSGIDWVIVGGESGPGHRPMLIEWVREIRDQCAAQGVAFFFKQWGHISNNPVPSDPTAKENGGTAKGGCLLDGQEYKEFPA